MNTVFQPAGGKAEYVARQREVGEVYRRVLSVIFPAMSMLVVAGLIEDEALLEIEATAHIATPREVS